LSLTTFRSYWNITDLNRNCSNGEMCVCAINIDYCSKKETRELVQWADSCELKREWCVIKMVSNNTTQLSFLTGSTDMDNDALFEGIMKHIGLNGKYQSRFNYVFNLIFIIFLAMPYLNLVLAMTIPEHWCHVPGRNETNMTEDEWKQLTIPR